MRINKKSDLPKWFNIENYKYMKELKDDEIFYLILCRLNDLVAKSFYDDNYFERNPYCGIESIEFNLREKTSKGKYELSSSSSITPVSIANLNGFKEELLDIGIDMQDRNIKRNHISTYKQDNSPLAYWDGVVCSIHLLNYQDETIIEQLRGLLKKWRKELDIEESLPLINNSWEVIKSKIINYNIFAFFDLQLWQFATGNSITGGVLSVTLYPEGEYDSTQITQTIKPFSEKLFTYETLEKIEREISNK
ncbi:DUF6387 family protein [Xenorhabdus bovienii]|uniref:DUF6387 family protein n=1 Tax=Xenorhabdus bovienii TaxID=40576 RepID=UPI0023B28D6A|nr:DUF6387 family protein [Xenorhabdus bovienii]MDE9519812.1 DUF6387 family protein [Xenorhabdus bovienii]